MKSILCDLTSNVTFGYRFDDTNPEAEKQEYIDHIHEIVNWMGWKPFKVLLHNFLLSLRRESSFFFWNFCDSLWGLAESNVSFLLACRLRTVVTTLLSSTNWPWN